MNRTPGRAARLLAAILLAALAAGACSSSASLTSRDGVEAPAAVPQADEPLGNDGVSTSEGSAAGEAPGDTQKDRDFAGSDTAEGLLIIKTGSLVLEVDDIATTLTKARGIVTGLGGYVSGSDEANEGERHVAVITYRIPAERWDEALDALRALARKVVTEKTNAVEVTGQVRDLAAWISTYQAEERSLQAIMEKATKVSDILEIESRLFEVRGQIEALQAQKKSLEEQAADGTLVVTYETPVVAVEEVKEGWDIGDELDRAVAALVSVGQGLASGLLWFVIVVLPVLVVVAIALLVVWFILRRVARRLPRPESRAWTPAATAPLWGTVPGAVTAQPSQPASQTPASQQAVEPVQPAAVRPDSDDSHGA